MEHHGGSILHVRGRFTRMHWNFARIGGLPEFIRIELSGLFDAGQFATMIDDLAALPYFDLGSRLLFDDTTLDLAHMSDKELIEASDAFIGGNKILAYSKVAIVTTPETFDIGRKFEKITEYGSRAIMQIFDDENS